MTTERLYYQDAYTTTFSANVLDRLTVDNRAGVILDKTYFYPTSGGQPHDLGQINGAAVIDVYVRLEDQAIIHVLSEPIESSKINARIDWDRRFDHMQQHSGQHILSRTFLDLAGYETISFHLGQDSCTIDLQHDIVGDNLQKEVEIAANRLVWEDRPVSVQIVASNELGSQALRSKAEPLGDVIRLVNIGDYDLTPCGGTHVARTGEIGFIKIIRTEKSGDDIRVHFICGGRALSDYRLKNTLVNALSAEFTTSFENIPDSIDKLKSDLKSMKHEHRKLQRQNLEFKAMELLRNGQRYSSVTVVNQSFDAMDPAEMRLLATLITNAPKTFALLGTNKPRLQFVFGRSTDVPGNMDELLLQILADFESASGGGSHVMAQGGGKEVEVELLVQALAKAENILVRQLDD